MGLLARGREGDGVVDPVLGRTAGNVIISEQEKTKPISPQINYLCEVKTWEEVNGEGLNTTSGEQET